jgi:hypothetical protein
MQTFEPIQFCVQATNRYPDRTHKPGPLFGPFWVIWRSVSVYNCVNKLC